MKWLRLASQYTKCDKAEANTGMASDITEGDPRQEPPRSSWTPRWRRHKGKSTYTQDKIPAIPHKSALTYREFLKLLRWECFATALEGKKRILMQGQSDTHIFYFARRLAEVAGKPHFLLNAQDIPDRHWIGPGISQWPETTAFLRIQEIGAARDFPLIIDDVWRYEAPQIRQIRQFLDGHLSVCFFPSLWIHPDWMSPCLDLQFDAELHVERDAAEQFYARQELTVCLREPATGTRTKICMSTYLPTAGAQAATTGQPVPVQPDPAACEEDKQMPATQAATRQLPNSTKPAAQGCRNG